MVTVYIQGGLGNQMFQYACGYSIAKKNHDSLQLDLSSYTSTDKGMADFRPYKLDELKIDKVTTFSLCESAEGKADEFVKKIKRRIRLGIVFDKAYKSDERDVSVFYPELFKYKKNIHLVGWWCNRNYFDWCRDDIVRQYVAKNLSDDAKKAISEIKKTSDSCMIHVRGGDYKKVGWCIDEKYYVEAIKKIHQVASPKKYYVFTNDTNYAKDILPSECEYIFTSSLWNLSDIDEQYVMSFFKYMIIAHSSFSWWAAYLNRRKDAVIIAPGLKGMWNGMNCDEWMIIPSRLKNEQ